MELSETLKNIILGCIFLILAILVSWRNRRFVERKKSEDAYDNYDKNSGRVNRIGAVLVLLLFSLIFLLKAL